MPLATNADVDERATCLNRNIKEVLFFFSFARSDELIIGSVIQIR